MDESPRSLMRTRPAGGGVDRQGESSASMTKWFSDIWLERLDSAPS
ncbi:hypothetical protein [Butyricicoccus pullicaecorum]